MYTFGTMMRWREQSAENGRKWVVNYDEQNPADSGMLPDEFTDHYDSRQVHLWPAMMGGAAGIEYYFGYQYPHNDLNLEDWRSREKLWDYTRITKDFFTTHLDFWNMKPIDGTNKKYNIFGAYERCYAIYFKSAVDQSDFQLNLPYGVYSIQWYNPRVGIFQSIITGGLIQGSMSGIQGGTTITELGLPPFETALDWVVLLKQQ
eukprot:TRINITY_DN16620_c1_g2_i1.p1 TRINITY_DN16620_c1_g2~~TRINITY_DN16620_c1_g2_i1.p1  ORF type:complete len:204 (+),score=32.44 TRINITY_DN16620_c1_g2_i1:126-737(+)